MAEHENIVLHYFSVKALALSAGFSEADAQTVAEISQFLGDNSAPVTLTAGVELPDLLRRGLATLEHDNTCTVFCRRTGLSQTEWFDKATLENRDVQLDVIVPFHMPPPEALDRGDERAYYMTGSKSAVFDALAEQALVRAGENRAALLVRAGVLSHLLFDMYSHMHLCGLASGTHAAELVQAREDRSDVTERYNTDAVKNLPPVGFSRLSRATDDCWLNIGYALGKTPPKTIYRRNNSDKYSSDAAERVYRLLLRFNGKSPEPLSAVMRETLAKTYLLASSEYGAVETKWTAAFVNGSPQLFKTEFHYSADKVYDALYGGDEKLPGPERFRMLTEFVLAAEDVMGAVYAAEN